MRRPEDTPRSALFPLKMNETDEEVSVGTTDERESVDATDVHPVAVERMVRAVEPAWSVEEIRPTEEGTDYVAFLTVSTPNGWREVVLKAFARDVVADTVARSEPRLLELLGDETDVPVPEVIGDGDDRRDRSSDLPTPFFIAERLPGRDGSGRFQELSTDALERVFADAGSYLAQLHDLRSFERFGRVGVRESESGEPTEGDDLGVVGDDSPPRDRWTDWLLADAEDTLDGMAGGRFDDLVTPLREYVREAIPALDGPESAALVHWDYRLGNLLLDPETGETTGVLDWADLIAGDPVYNLATVEDHNLNWQTRDTVLRRRLRERFRAAYDARRADDLAAGDPSAGFRERKRIYHLCNRLNAMACLPDWYASAEETVRDERAAEHRMFVREYLD